MLEPLRQQISAALRGVDTATLATSGPGGLLADTYPCEAINLRLYLLLPRTSDHLVNLHSSEEALVVTETWRLHGKARVIQQDECPEPLRLLTAADAKWRVVVEIQPDRIELDPIDGWGYRETIDL